MLIDAKSARALARRTHTLADCLAAMKKAIIEAAQLGEFEVGIGLPDPIPLAAGQSTNDAAFLIAFFIRHGNEAWADAVQHAVRAGYVARPSWCSVATGAAVDGLVLSWFQVEAPSGPQASRLLMPATVAHAMSQGEHAHQRWVETLTVDIRDAALQGKSTITVLDSMPCADPTWAKRREILQRAGYSVELIAVDRGTAVVIAW